MQSTIRTRSTGFDAAAALLARAATGGVTALRAAWRAITGAFAPWRRTRWQTLELDWLDERTLRDLGLDRSECASYLAESSGIAAPTRRRVAAARRTTRT